MFDSVAGIIIISVIIIGLGFSGIKAAKVPVVLISYESGKCVNVINFNDDKFTCDNMPKKYSREFVK